MSKITIPKNYKSELNLYDTQIGIKTVKDFFQNLLAENLNLLRVSAPLFVTPESGLNDNLNGVERPVRFGILEQDDYEVEIVQSLAKWKRYALKKYGFKEGEGLYTDMNAIRRDEDTDNIHSIYVDQWDWEVVINKEDRNLSTLKKFVEKIYLALKHTERYIVEEYDFGWKDSDEDKEKKIIKRKNFVDRTKKEKLFQKITDRWTSIYSSSNLSENEKEEKCIASISSLISNHILFHELNTVFKHSLLQLPIKGTIHLELSDSYPFLPEINASKYKYSLVVDLDETLIHSFTLNNNNDQTFYVRPFVLNF